MTITAKMIAHSVGPTGQPVATMLLCYPKFIHGEFMTHRVFSRNASSSRAIPVKRLIQDVMDDPAVPLKWFRNKPGMQGAEEITGSDRDRMIQLWLNARNQAVATATALTMGEAHKQHVNRVIEPFCHIRTLVTSTKWSNFFALRDHPDAQPEIRELALQMRQALGESRPKSLEYGEWHLPFVTFADRATYTPIDCVRASVARCARVSYLTNEGKEPNMTDDRELYLRLVGSKPLHASPAEHQASPARFGAEGGNLGSDWIQYRKMLPGESQ